METSGSLLVDGVFRLCGCLDVVSIRGWCWELLVEPLRELRFNQGGRAVDQPNSRNGLQVWLVVAILLIAELL